MQILTESTKSASHAKNDFLFLRIYPFVSQTSVGVPLHQYAQIVRVNSAVETHQEKEILRRLNQTSSQQFFVTACRFSQKIPLMQD